MVRPRTGVRRGGALDSDRDTKQHLKEFLVAEQRELCCYCESRVMPTETSSHLEHLDPRSERGDLEVTYENLLASCNRRGTCGDGKKSDALRVTPLDEDCARAFRYYGDGTVEAFAGFGRIEDARSALRVLKIDRPEVVWRRRAVLETVDELEGPDLESLKAELSAATGTLPEFATALRQHLGILRSEGLR